MFILSGSNRGKGFTLPEVLVVLILLGVLFSIVGTVFLRGSDSALSVIERAEKLKLEVSLFWDLQRKIIGSRNLKVEGDAIYMVSSGGSYYPGVVKCAYLFKHGKLYYYEYPYPLGALDEVEEDKLVLIGNFESVTFSAIERDREYETYEGLPDYVKVSVNGKDLIFQTLKLR